VIIGINRYTHLGSLSGAVNDASGFAELLQTEFNFPCGNTHLLVDEQATQPAIRERLELLAQQSKRDDRVIFYFAGHGQTRQVPEGGEIGYLAVSESKPGKWDTLIRIDDITRHSQLIPAKHVLFVFDACFSGLALTRGVAAATSPDMRRWLKECMTHKVRQVLTAGLAEQTVADLIEDGHSVFTSYLLRGLRGGAAGSEGEITASQLMAYVTDAVMKDNRSKQKPASGEIEGSEPGGDLVFTHPELRHFMVPANREGGINTGIQLQAGDTVSVLASGVVSYDSWHHYTNAEGLHTTYKGQPLAHPQELKPFVLPHPDAYRTDGDRPGLVGSLFGWVGAYSEQSAFFIGEKAEITVSVGGYLYLSVNDAKGTYEDNAGEFEVTVRIR
jgi:hypothetical protein